MTDIPILGQKAEPEEPPEIQAATAYLVVIGSDGTVAVMQDVSNAGHITLQRIASIDDIHGSARILGDAMQTSKTAGAVQQMMLQTTAAMAEAKINQDITANINRTKR